ncbi:MAG: hypothetical protein NPIRA06_16120 [Nitrospirales bacterium]|nr:MAG: hypothetical protein NPIRA06_16120 [Nitrospirales bacterium]
MTALSKFSAVLLDMNSTFMFGEDRFGADENFFEYYRTTKGQLSEEAVDDIIRSAYSYLDRLYPDPEYRESFPTLEIAIRSVVKEQLPNHEIDSLIATFAYHELGHIPPNYADAIRTLADTYLLGAVIDIWAPKDCWIDEFRRTNVYHCFSAFSFSSDIGAVKPSTLGFLRVAKQLGVAPANVIVIGDSTRRDLGGAIAAGMECILVGGETDSRAYCVAKNLLEIVHG